MRHGDLVKVVKLMEPERIRFVENLLGSVGILVSAVAIPDHIAGEALFNGWEVMFPNGLDYLYEIELEVVSEKR